MSWLTSLRWAATKVAKAVPFNVHAKVRCAATENSLAQLEVGFDISTLKALVIIHVHIDHVGRLLYLLAAGCWLLAIRARFLIPSLPPYFYRW